MSSYVWCMSVLARRWMPGKYTCCHHEDIFWRYSREGRHGDLTAWDASEEKKAILWKLTMNIKDLQYCAPQRHFLLPCYESIHMTQLLHGQVLKIQAFKKLTFWPENLFWCYNRVKQDFSVLRRRKRMLKRHHYYSILHHDVLPRQRMLLLDLCSN